MALHWPITIVTGHIDLTCSCISREVRVRLCGRLVLKRVSAYDVGFPQKSKSDISGMKRHCGSLWLDSLSYSFHLLPDRSTMRLFCPVFLETWSSISFCSGLVCFFPPHRIPDLWKVSSSQRKAKWVPCGPKERKPPKLTVNVTLFVIFKVLMGLHKLILQAGVRKIIVKVA